MLKKSVAVLAALTGVAIAASEAQAGPRFDFINKYIEKYAKVKSDDTIGNGRFNLGNFLDEDKDKDEDKGPRTSTSSSRLSSLKSRLPK
jgi:hypothetical protein